MILHNEGGTQAQEDEARLILGTLCDAYPGHAWSVRVYDGGFFIRYLDPNLSGNYGMNVKFRDVSHDAAVLKREIIMNAGEFLERAGLVRGRNNEDEIVRVEGVPDKYQPHRTIELKPLDQRDTFRQAEEMQKTVDRMNG